MRSKTYDNKPDYRKECHCLYDGTSENCGYCDSPIDRCDAYCTYCGAPTGRCPEILVQDNGRYESECSDYDCLCKKYDGKSKVLRFLSIFSPQTVMYFVGIWNGKGTKRHKLMKICAVIGFFSALFILGLIA